MRKVKNCPGVRFKSSRRKPVKSLGEGSLKRKVFKKVCFVQWFAVLKREDLDVW